MFNSKKSVCMKDGHKWSSDVIKMSMNYAILDWVNNIKYIGIMFTNGNC